MIYFDNSATTHIYPEVLDTYIKTSQRIIGNPSSLYDLGIQAERLVNQARRQIADLLHVKKEEIFFTSGGTEGDNWVVKGTAIEKRRYGQHMIVSAIEHPAVMESAKQLQELGFELSVAPVDANGFVQVTALEQLIRPDTILVSVMAVNNEIGSIQPIQEIAKCLEKYPKIHFHVDAVQAIGKVDRQRWLPDRVDFATFSAHKFHGPKGVGFLYWKEGRRICPLLHGGGQENTVRSGTENIAGIVSMSKALRIYLDKINLKPLHVATIRNYLIESLDDYPKVRLFSAKLDSFAPTILCFSLKGIRGEVLVHALEAKQIYLSTTSACSSKKKMSSNTLRAMGVSEAIAASAVRISLDESNTVAEAEQFMIIFQQLYQKFASLTN